MAELFDGVDYLMSVFLSGEGNSWIFQIKLFLVGGRDSYVIDFIGF